MGARKVPLIIPLTNSHAIAAQATKMPRGQHDFVQQFSLVFIFSLRFMFQVGILTSISSAGIKDSDS